MIFVSLLLLGSTAIAFAIVPGESSAENEDQAEDEAENIEREQVIDEFKRAEVKDLLDIAFADDDSESPGGDRIDGAFLTQDGADPMGEISGEGDGAIGSSNSEAGDQEIANFTLDDDVISRLPPAASDWFVEEEVETIAATKNEAVSIQSTASTPGSLLVLSADYVEQGADENDVVTRHTGSNVYFVPDGETFFDRYEWSVEGAVLYDTESSSDEDADAPGIKLVARVETGSWTFQAQAGADPATLHDTRIGQPQIVSNLAIFHR